MGEVREGLDAVVDLALEDGGVDPVRGDVLDVEVLDVFAHRAEGCAGVGEVGAFVVQGVLVVLGVLGFSGGGGFWVVRLHGVPPAVWRRGDFRWGGGWGANGFPPTPPLPETLRG
ncbi:hypothetical protein GCM10010388_12440 [Streptomyces mauvecolor]